ncbi:MAG: hypothetical protein GX793_10300 [Bacteroidales bacterium]|jgi:L-serine dehydratase|nr:L-serine ammonia-lyase, iron-sulfur-dependent, subunit alpha [Bacteroidales bacterium]MCK9498797.1 L-serine ammonia-lyase, iron-sulfur-dependent, subunit alpha [Bacteroidales bacterium]MDY0313860.1 L-serine ammonia-lyase, iron-sulfur-dependent, subunit alpha [Bacteroidales bacterium]NLB87437.1 hypothetical protein [Bacteroidales bacterium]
MEENKAKNKSQKYLNFLKSCLPPIYFEIMDKEDYVTHYKLIKRTIAPEGKDKFFHMRGDIEEFYSHSFSYDKLKSTLLKESAEVSGNVAIYRIFPNEKEDFILSSTYKSIIFSPRFKEFVIPSRETIKQTFFDEKEKLIKDIEVSLETKTKQVIVQCMNISFNTLLSNLFETLEKQEIKYNFISIIQITKPLNKNNKYYKIEIHLEKRLLKADFISLKEDFERYIQTSIQALSIFDMIGPSMVGPSSSHTAGANRIGQISRNIILAIIERGEKIKDIELKLYSSFRDTGIGHKTPSALGGGLYGFATDHPEMIQHGEPEFLKEKGIKFGSQTAKFKGFIKASPSEDLKFLSQRNNNIAEIIFSTDKQNYSITGFSIGAGNVEIRFFNGHELNTPIDGKTDLRLKANEIINSKDSKYPIIKKIYSQQSESEKPRLDFNTFEELEEYLEKTGKSIIDVICETEFALQGSQKEDVYSKMQEYWEIMKDSVYTGISTSEQSLLKLSGGDSKKIVSFLPQSNLFNNVYGKAAAYATAVNEINAKSGVIIACPTAGSCGILPGVLTAWMEDNPNSERKILESLMVAGFFGMILFTDVSTAGADYGCQAEIGAAAAMAASAIAYLENGSHAQMIQAFTIAIKNSLGLICDPVAGLVEVPCVKRNGIYSSLALSAALMALSGVQSFISPDEVMLTMREVGERLHIDYKETGRGGLARTRDGKEVEKRFAQEVKKFFD